MPRSYKIIGFLMVTLLGVYGCAKGPGAGTTESGSATAKIQRLEEDYRSAITARDQLRVRLTASEDQVAKAQKGQKDVEQQLEQARAAAAAERDTLKAEVKARVGERDAVNSQYEGFRKTLRDMIGSADTAVGKLNLPPPQIEVVGATLGTAQN